MSRIINTAKTLRRNWKKSTFFFGVLAYGGSYFTDKYQTHQMMRAYCEEARKYGDKPLYQTMKPKHVTVILNPEANYKKSNVQFEKFAAPLLHLAGFKVSVFQTEKEKQAQELMQVMSNTDAVIVAGGNGTLQEAVTGLLLRPNPEEDKLPLGIVPLGKTNTIAEYLFGAKSSSRAQLMAEAVMAIIRETTVRLDVLKIQYLDEDKPVFAMCNFEQGIFADVDLLVQKYWYLGSLKERFTYFVNSLKEWQPIENKCVEYVAPCSGCSKCYVASKKKETAEQSRRWWHVFVPKTGDTRVAASEDPEEDFSNRISEDCGKHIPLQTEYSTISISTAAEKSGSLSIKIFPKDLSVRQFITTGLSHRKCKQQDTTGIARVVEARELTIEVDSPSNDTEKQSSRSEIVVSASSVEPPTSDGDVSSRSNVIRSSISDDVGSSTLSNGESANLSNGESSNLSNGDTNLKSDTNLSYGQSTNLSKGDTNFSKGVSTNLRSDTNLSTGDTNLSNGESTNLSNVDTNLRSDTNLSNGESTNSSTVQTYISETTRLEGVPRSVSDGDEPASLNSDEVNQAAETLDSVPPPEQTESSVKSDVIAKNQFSYIDNEKYRRASCKISILPKQVTVFG